jgi:hypothetical protein
MDQGVVHSEEQTEIQSGSECNTGNALSHGAPAQQHAQQHIKLHITQAGACITGGFQQTKKI